jgi:hypothetical protein
VTHSDLPPLDAPEEAFEVDALVAGFLLGQVGFDGVDRAMEGVLVVVAEVSLEQVALTRYRAAPLAAP